MNCENVEKLISAYIDRELPSNLEPKVRYHLAYCEKCFRTYAEMQKTKELLSSLKSHPLPDTFWKETRAKFRHQVETPVSQPRRSSSRLWTALAAAACLLLTASLVSLAPDPSTEISYFASPTDESPAPATVSYQSASLMDSSNSLGYEPLSEPSYEELRELNYARPRDLIRSRVQGRVLSAAFEDPSSGLIVFDLGRMLKVDDSRVLNVDDFELPEGETGGPEDPLDDTASPGNKQKARTYYGSPTLVPAGWSGGK